MLKAYLCFLSYFDRFIESHSEVVLRTFKYSGASTAKTLSQTSSTISEMVVLWIRNRLSLKGRESFPCCQVSKGHGYPLVCFYGFPQNCILFGNCWLKTTDKLEELLFVHSEVALKSQLVFCQHLLYYLVKCSTFISSLDPRSCPNCPISLSLYIFISKQQS